MTWLKQFEDRANLNGSNGVNNDEITQMALWSGFDEERAKYDIRLAHFYVFAISKRKEKNTGEHDSLQDSKLKEQK